MQRMIAKAANLSIIPKEPPKLYKPNPELRARYGFDQYDEFDEEWLVDHRDIKKQW